jgi:hypothetical protein
MRRSVSRPSQVLMLGWSGIPDPVALAFEKCGGLVQDLFVCFLLGDP